MDIHADNNMDFHTRISIFVLDVLLYFFHTRLTMYIRIDNVDAHRIRSCDGMHGKGKTWGNRTHVDGGDGHMWTDIALLLHSYVLAQYNRSGHVVVVDTMFAVKSSPRLPPPPVSWVPPMSMSGSLT